MTNRQMSYHIKLRQRIFFTIQRRWLACGIFFIAICILSGCKKSVAYSDIPEVHFQKLETKDILDELGSSKACILYFSFIDGNGDLGVRDELSTRSRLYTYWYQKLQDESYQRYHFVDDALTQYDIPYNEVMNKDDAYNKVLRGKAKAVIAIPQNVSGMDTVYLEFYIADRAANKSNLEKTPVFSVLKDTVLLAK